MLEKITGGYKTKAKIVDDTLVLSFPDAKNPSVWRLDLDQAGGTSFELYTNDKDKVFELVQKDEKDKRKTIASYDSRPKAMRALMQASEALEKGAKKKKSKIPFGKILGLLALLILGYAVYIAATTTAQSPADRTNTTEAIQQKVQQVQPAQPDTVISAPAPAHDSSVMRDGYPVDADVFLQTLEQESTRR